MFNASDISTLQQIQSQGLGMDDLIPGAYSGIGTTTRVPVGLSLSRNSPETVRDFYDDLRTRGFFTTTDPSTGEVRTTTPEEIYEKSKDDPLGAFMYGDKPISDNGLIDFAFKMGTDPVNYLFGLGVIGKVAKGIGLTERLVGLAGKVAPWAAAPRLVGGASLGQLEALRGVGYFDDMVKAGLRSTELAPASAGAQALIAGNASQATLKSLAFALKVAKQVYLPGRGSLGLRYLTGATAQNLGIQAVSHAAGIASQAFDPTGGQTDPEGNLIHSGFFASVHDASEAILDNHPLSGDPLFTVVTLFNTPLHQAFKATKVVKRELSAKYFGSDIAPRYAQVFAPEVRGAAATDAMYRKLGGAKFDEATGKFDLTTGDIELGKREFARLVDHVQLYQAFQRLKTDQGFILAAKSFDHTVMSGAPMMEVLRWYRDLLVKQGVIGGSKDSIKVFQNWGERQATSYMDEAGLMQMFDNPGGWAIPPDALINQWNVYINGNKALSAATGDMVGVVLGKSQNMTREGADALIAVVDRATADGMIPTDVVRGLLVSRPAMFVDPAIPRSTAEYFASLMNEGVAAGKGVHAGAKPFTYDAVELRAHLVKLRDKLPTGAELTHEAAALEGKVLDDTQMAGQAGPLRPGGVERIWTRKEVEAHSLRSISDGKAAVADLKVAEQHMKDRWTKRGNYRPIETARRAAPEVMAKTMDEGPTGGGATFDPVSGKFDTGTDGFAVELPGGTRIAPGDTAALAREMQRIVRENPDALIGTWHDKAAGEVTVGPTKIASSLEEARALGGTREQFFYDRSTGKDVANPDYQPVVTITSSVLNDLARARSARLEPDWRSDGLGVTRELTIGGTHYPAKFPKESAANGFEVKQYATGEGNGLGVMFYGADGKAAGFFSGLLEGKDAGAFKIVVDPAVQRSGIGMKLLNEAEANGFDIANNISKNTFTPSGRALVKRWLESKTLAPEAPAATVEPMVLTRGTKAWPGPIVPENLTPAGPFVYHSTPAANFESIRSNGLEPREPMYRGGKYPTGDPAGVYFAKDGNILRDYVSGYKNPVILRVARKDAGLAIGVESLGTDFTRAAVKPESIEFLGADGAWHPLKPEAPAAGAPRSPQVVVPADALPVGTDVQHITSPRINGQVIRGRKVISPSDGRIPDTVYHVTTDKPAVEASRVVEARGEGGLGGDKNDRVVSMTIDRAIAEQLVVDIKFNAVIHQTPITDVPKALEAQAQAEGWLQKWLDSGLYDKNGVPLDHLKYDAGDWLTHYFNVRSSATGVVNPIFFGGGGKGVDPAKVGIVEIPKENLNNGALLMDFDLADRISLKEIRSYGDVRIAEPKPVENPAIQANLDALRVSDRAHVDALKAEVARIKKDVLDLRARGEELGVVDLHYTFHDTRTGKLKVAAEDLQRVQEQARWVNENLPNYELKRAPQLYLPWNAADSAAAAISVQRTNLGRIMFDIGPLSKLTQIIDWAIEPIAAGARRRDTIKMLYSTFMPMGAKEAEVTTFIRELARRRHEGGTLGKMQITVNRYDNSLLPSQLRQAGEVAFGKNKAVMDAVRQRFGGEFWKPLDQASNSLVRQGLRLMMKKGESRLSGQNILARTFAKGYSAWQRAGTFSSATRFIDKTMYPMFRFYTSPRWQLMNMLENDLIGMFQDGIRANRYARGSTSLATRRAYDSAQAKAYGRGTDPRLAGEAPPGSTGVPDALLAETGAVTPGWFMDPVMRNQFTFRAAEDVTKAIDALGLYSPEAKWFVDHFGTNKGTWAEQVEQMWHDFDAKGVTKTLDGAIKEVRISDAWTPEEAMMMQPFLLKLGERQAQIYDDIAHIQLGNTDRSRLERALNSYWAYWPLSYQIKSTKWMVDLLTNRMFGRQTNLGGAYMLAHANEILVEEMKNNPDFAKTLEENPTLWLVGSMLFPAVPWDQGVSLSRIPRYIGANILHLWPDYAGINSPVDAVSKSLLLGPNYDAELGSRLLSEWGVGQEASPPTIH
jgi:GNAT superfamily N-acetyltransferase